MPINPDGISNGTKIIRPIVSESMVKQDPINALPKRLYLCEYPKIKRDILGDIRPINPRLPTPATATAVRSNANIIIISFHWTPLKPILLAISSDNNRISSCLVKQKDNPIRNNAG